MSLREQQLEQQVGELAEQVKTLTAELGRAQEQIEHLRKQLFGPKSDRPSDKAQLLLAELLNQLQQSESGPDPAPDSSEDSADEDADEQQGKGNEKGGNRQPGKKRRKRGPANAKRLSLENTGLEERVTEIAGDPNEIINPATGEPYPILRYEETRRLAEEPAKMFVLVIRRPVYIKENELGERTLITTPVPANNPIERCKADVSLLAGVLIYKYMFHLSLYRIQEMLYEGSHMWLARSTLCGWVTGCALALEPIVKLMRERMMLESVIGLDDTTICELAPGKGQVDTAKLWAYTCALEGAPYVVYDYTKSREAKHPLSFIPESYQGYVQGDAYSGHEELMRRPGVTGVGCWDHARRYFTDASANDPKLASEAIALIKLLYKVEEQGKGKSSEEIKALREEKSQPILNELKQWAEQTAKDPFLKEGMRRAVGYLNNQWERLTCYLKDGRIPISNIYTEQAMRGVGIGRKNWLFVGSEGGGQSLAIILSLVTTCRNLGINVRQYFQDVLARVNSHPHARLEELLPDQWMQIQEAAGKKVTLTPRREWRKESPVLAA